MHRHLIKMVAGLLVVAPIFSAQGDDLNRRRDMDASSSSKMLRAEAEAMRQGQGQAMRQPLTKAARCGVSVGNVTVQRGAMAPREVNTLVKGDVISVCK